MKIAVVTVENGGVVEPDQFFEEEVQEAKKQGVILRQVYSKTIRQQYTANVCGFCNSFVGDHFLREYGYDLQYDTRQETASTCTECVRYFSGGVYAGLSDAG
jgi:hypothetical protein